MTNCKDISYYYVNSNYYCFNHRDDFGGVLFHQGGLTMTGRKHSRQRDFILDFLQGRADHPTADLIYANVRQSCPNISLGTVYRNLSLLCESGEIQKVYGLDGADRFDPRTDWHSHFVCLQCGKVQDLNTVDVNVSEMVHRASASCNGGTISSCRISYFGRCSSCGG